MTERKYRILIADDEALIREGIRHAISKTGDSFLIAGEADNGKAVLELLEKRQDIDIVLMDIRMPIMDGIASLRHIRENGYSVKVIIVSNYADFSYAKESIQLGAHGYILKNELIDGYALKEVLYGVVEKIENDALLSKEVDSLKSKLKMSREEIKTNFFLQLLSDQICNETFMQTEINELQLKFNGNYFCCVVAEITDFTFKNDESTGRDKRVEKAVLSTINESLDINKSGVVFSLGNFKYALLFDIDDEEHEQKIIKTLSDITHLIENNFIADIIYGMSGNYSGLNMISKAFEQAEGLLSEKFYHKSGDIIRSKKDMGEIDLEKTRQITQQILDSITVRDLMECRKKVSELLDELRKKKSSKWQVKGYIIELCRKCIASGNKDHSLQDLISLNSMDSFSSYDMMANYVTDCITRYVHVLIEEDSRYNRREIEMVKSYIEEYYNRDITLSQLAEYVNLNASYLSYLFKKEMNDNVINYLNAKRIDHAKKLLKETDMKIYEIAEKVGIPDSKHFCRVFKKFAKVPPNQYKG